MTRPNPDDYGSWQDWGRALMRGLVEVEPAVETTRKLPRVPEDHLPTMSAKEPGQYVWVNSPLGPSSDWIAVSRNGAWEILWS